MSRVAARKRDSFRDLAPDVKPLPQKAARVPEPNAPAAPPSRSDLESSSLPPLIVERGVEWARGYTEGLDKRRLTQLSRGQPRPVSSVDVHGSVAADARRTVAKFLQDAHSRGQRSVLVVFGRGLHSGARGPVLRDEMITLLSETLSHRVLAFCSAPGVLGGSGAFVVLLRRSK